MGCGYTPAAPGTLACGTAMGSPAPFGIPASVVLAVVVLTLFGREVRRWPVRGAGAG